MDPLLEGGSTAKAPSRAARSLLQRLSALTIGAFGWRYLFQPFVLFTQRRRGQDALRFRSVSDVLPILWTLFLGVQHVVAAFAFIVLPPFALQGIFPTSFHHYAVQSAFIIAGLGSVLHVMHFKIPGTPYYIGSGLCAFLGNSVLMANTFANLMQRHGLDEEGRADEAYGKLLGTSAVCSLVLLALAFVPRRVTAHLFPPVVSGTLIVLVGMDALTTGIAFWGGGEDCAMYPIPCTLTGNVHLLYGSAEYIGLGLFVATLFLCFELFGSAFMRHNSIFFSVLVVYIISMVVTYDGHRYVTGDIVREARPWNILWTTTYPMGFYRFAVMPLIGMYLVTYLETVAVVSATAEASQLEPAETAARIQGGVLSTALVSLVSALATGMPVMSIPQNVGVPYLSRVASQWTGIAAAVLLVLGGILGKLLGLALEIPIAVYGGILTLLSSTVIITGLKVLAGVQWNRRASWIVVGSLSVGVATLVAPNFISDALWPLGNDPRDFEESLQMAVVSSMRVPYFLGGVFAVGLNLVLPENMECGTEMEED